MKNENIKISDSEHFDSMEEINEVVRKKYKNIKKRHWVYIVYPESAPEYWIEKLENSMIQFAVSPLHDRDLDVSGNLKKPHWHIILSFDGPTTFNVASSYCEITNGPLPKPCGSLKGAYEYFTHKNNADKYQYSSKDIQQYNGFVVEMSKNESMRIKKELANLIESENITEMIVLDHIVRNLYSDEYYDVLIHSTFYFNALICSLRHNPGVVAEKMSKMKSKFSINKNEEEKKNEN